MANKQKLFALISSSIIVVIFFIYFISIYFGSNPLNNSYLSQIKIISVFPQGWAFFTRNSKEPRLYTFTLKNKKLEELNLRNSSPKYYFGISRLNRILNIEINNVFQKISSDSLNAYEFKSITVEKLAHDIDIDSLKFFKIKISQSKCPNLKGKYVLIVQLMLPWSILHSQPNFLSHFKVFPVEIIYV